MSHTFTVTTTDIEDKALRWAERDPQQWLEVVVKNRAKAAMTELYSIELKKALADPNIAQISSDMAEVVLASTELTALQKQEKAELEMTLNPAKMAELTTPTVIGDTPRTFLGGGVV